MWKGILALWCAGTMATFGQAVLEPPLGMKWGDRPERLIQWADQHELDVGIDLPARSPEMRVIRLSRSSPSQPIENGIRRIEARYVEGRMIEMTLHYGGQGNSGEQVEADFNLEKKRLTTEHGKFIANQHEKVVKNEFSTETRSLHREPVRGLFLLIAFTRIEDLLRHQSEAEYSVMYRNDNLRIMIENQRAEDPGKAR